MYQLESNHVCSEVNNVKIVSQNVIIEVCYDECVEVYAWA